MPIEIGPGIVVGNGITIGSGPAVVTSGLTMQLDSALYPGSGATWADVSGNGANQTLVNAPAYTPGTPSYFTFNGSNQYSTGSTANVVPASAYTKSVWFYFNSNTDNNLVSSATGGHFMFTASSSTLYAGHANVFPYNGFGSLSSISLNTWYYAAVTFSISAGIKIYINGVLDNSNAGFTTAHTGDGSTNLACFAPGGNLLNGRIAEVFCYSRVLSDAEVLQNFNATRSRYGI